MVAEARPHPDRLDRFMADAARILGSTLDVEGTLHQVAALAVPDLADWCAIDLLRPDGSLVPVAAAHRDPALRDLVAELLRDYPADPTAPVGAYRVARDGRSMSLDFTPEMIATVARSPRHAEILNALDLATWMGVPMIAGDRVLGTIAFAGTPARGAFEARHVAVAESLGIRAAAALANAQAFTAADRFRRILDAVSEAVFLLRPLDAVILDVNRGAVDLLGVPANAIVGRSLWSVIPDLDAGAIGPLIERLGDGHTETRAFDVAIGSPDGASVPVEIRLQRVDLPTDGPTVVAVARDIRDRKDAAAHLVRLVAAEHARAAELQAVIGAIGDGVLVCGADGTVVLRNPAAESIIGDAPPTYAGLLERFADAERLAPWLGTAGGPVALPLVADGDRWVELATYPVASDDGVDRRPETIVVLRDVTAARRRDAIRETFIGVLSHELRTPVTTIYGGAKLLSRRDSTIDAETRRAVFEDLVAESERLQRLVEDVVAMNRFGEAGTGDLGQEPVLLQRIVPGVVDSEGARWPGATFTTEVPPGLPTVVADPVYVEQVVRNLLSNAAKYGGDEVAIRVRLEAAEGEVVARIQDDGPGIRPEEASRLFELFYRSEGTADMAPGAGIGLFVCARLVQAMGGRIWARPLPSGGSEFGFALRVMSDE